MLKGGREGGSQRTRVLLPGAHVVCLKWRSCLVKLVLGRVFSRWDYERPWALGAAWRRLLELGVWTK